MRTTQLLIFVFFALALNTKAQTYNFSVSTGTYTNLTGSTSLNNGITWDDPEFTIPLGFNFDCFGNTVSQLYTFDLGGSLISSNANTGIFPSFIPYGADLIDRASTTTNYDGQSGSLSPISYKLEGITGSRILKIEWKNAGLYEDIEDDNISIDYVNFQCWFYEGTNEIEVHFGPNSVTQTSLVFYGEPGSSVGMCPNFDIDNWIATAPSSFLTGNPSSPTAVAITDPYDTTLNGVIPNGTIYNFTPPAAAGIFDISNDSEMISLFPNPSNDFFGLSYESNDVKVNTVSIQNVNGELIKEIDTDFNKIDISQFTSGVYFVKINTTSGVSVKRLIKK